MKLAKKGAMANAAQNMMTINLNGEPQSLPEGTTVAGLLAILDLPRAKVAVERNLEIVPKSSFDAVVLEPDDRLEIVHFIGGG